MRYSSTVRGSGMRYSLINMMITILVLVCQSVKGLRLLLLSNGQVGWGLLLTDPSFPPSTISFLFRFRQECLANGNHRFSLVMAGRCGGDAAWRRPALSRRAELHVYDLSGRENGRERAVARLVSPIPDSVLSTYFPDGPMVSPGVWSV